MTKGSEFNVSCASARWGSRAPCRAACRRMKGLVTTKKLRDIARAQQREVAALRTELDRLHMRTFPSFVDVNVALSPDEAIRLR
jgi:hypothetical protein